MSETLDRQLGETGAKQTIILNQSEPVLLTFARPLETKKDTLISFQPENLFGRHLAILGSSGAGKSWSVARLVEEAAEYNSKVVLFDATGEFYTLSKGTRHVYIGRDPNPRKNSHEVTVPFFHLTEGDLFAIFRPSGPSQGPKLRAAIKSLKLARLVPALAPDGTIVKAHKSKVEFQKQYEKHLAVLENPLADFDIRCLARQIQNECVDPQRSAIEPLVWGGPNANDYSMCVPLINEIQDVVQSPSLGPIFNPGKVPSLFKEVLAFLDDPTVSVLRISLKYLSFYHHAREIISNAIGRHFLELARSGRFRRRPLLVVLDEAHQFLNSALENGDLRHPLDSFALIAKEGRKYWITVCLATQRPRDIPEGVLSQMGTLVVHRLINDRDREIIERASGDLDQAAANLIPTLAPGEAVLIGMAFPQPLLVKVEPPVNKPESEGPDYQNYWAGQRN